MYRAAPSAGGGAVESVEELSRESAEPGGRPGRLLLMGTGTGRGPGVGAGTLKKGVEGGVGSGNPLPDPPSDVFLHVFRRGAQDKFFLIVF